MTHELVVGLTVTDEVTYAQYRAAMAPILAAHGGGFSYDFTLAKVLKSASAHPINRLFAIYFQSKARKDIFFADPDYLAIKARYFERSVAGTTILGSYDR
jgi:uncharacterized protein (DUF1330 family)